MRFTEGPVKGVYVIALEPSLDERGFFCRTFCRNRFEEIGHDKEIVQINHSRTKQRGAVRGLHYQAAPFCEVKIIRCISGTVFDVIVDLRRHSPTFLHHCTVKLSGDELQMVYIPEGCAHGFQVLDGSADLIYHHTAPYSLAHERGVRFDDPRLAIRWPLEITDISAKDLSYPLLSDNFMGIEL